MKYIFKNTFLLAAFYLLHIDSLCAQTAFKDASAKKWGYKNAAGKVIAKAKYDTLIIISDGFVAGGKKIKSMKYCLLDIISGKELTLFNYDEFGAFSKVKIVAVVVNPDNTYYLVVLDKQGKIITDKYSKIYEFSNGLATVAKGIIYGEKYKIINEGKWGFIDTSGVVIIPLIYDKAESFSEGFGSVKLNGKFGFVNEKGEIVIKCIYEKADDFKGGMAQVTLEGRSFAIDKNGKELSFEEMLHRKAELIKSKK